MWAGEGACSGGICAEDGLGGLLGRALGPCLRQMHGGPRCEAPSLNYVLKPSAYGSCWVSELLCCALQTTVGKTLLSTTAEHGHLQKWVRTRPRRGRTEPDRTAYGSLP